MTEPAEKPQPPGSYVRRTEVFPGVTGRRITITLLAGLLALCGTSALTDASIASYPVGIVAAALAWVLAKPGRA